MERNEQVPVYGDGLNVRDWIHVNDHCSGILAVLRKGRVGEVYNLGGKSERTNLELTHALLNNLQKPHSLIRYVKDRPGHDKRYAHHTKKQKALIDPDLGKPVKPRDVLFLDQQKFLDQRN